ncbi:hypothetical protein Q7P36_008415 [Cladosporium allicinum]
MEASDDSQNTSSDSGDPPIDDKEAPEEYSAESRTYHAYFDELQRAHVRGHYTWCRDHCLTLLLEPRIPLWTRIQTLQLLSTLCQPAGAEQCLQDADRVLDILDPEAFQTKLLQGDNRKMKADREVDRVENNLVGKDF